jgi:zinc/manganese transport system substrate-binding protein
MTPFGTRLVSHLQTRPPHLGLAVGLALWLVSAMALPGAAAEDEADEGPPAVVVATEMLGWLVDEVAADGADVIVLMHGVDPHAWEPSARDVEMTLGADLVVANGLGLEEGLHDVLEQVEASGVPVFQASDHITVREAGVGLGEEVDPEASDEDEAHAGGDPHLWLDPLAMRDVTIALVPVLEATGVSVGERGVALVRTLEQLDAEARTVLSVVPTERRRLVTGHESLGYFADRYGFELVGAVVPGFSSQGEVSAGALADLVETIRDAGVPAIFTEVGTPVSVAAAVAAETGAVIVELPTEQLPEDGSYLSFIRLISTRVAEALSE